MKIYKIALSFLAALSFTASVMAVDSPGVGTVNSYTSQVDSLRNLLETTTEADLFRVYSHLHKALYELEDIELHLQYNSRHIEDARAANNLKQVAVAYALRLEAFTNYMMPDSIVLEVAREALDVIRDIEGSELHYFYAARVMAEVYIYRGDYEEALRIAEQFYREASAMGDNSGIVISLQIMGRAYEELGLPEKAEESLREAIAASGKREYGLKGESYSDLINLLNAQGRDEEALAVCGEMEAFLDEIGAWDRELKNLYYLAYDGYTRSYINIGQYNKAWEYLSLMETFPVASTTMGMYDVGKHRFRLLLEEGKYNEAEETLDVLLKGMEDGTFVYSEVLRLKELRAELYYRWGSYRKAADTFKDYIIQKDSVQRVEMAERLNTLRTRYEVDRFEMQHEIQGQKIARQKNAITFTISILIVILAGLLATFRLYRKNRNAYRSLADKAQNWASCHECRFHTKRKTDVENIPDAEDTGIMESLYAFMEEKKAYKDPALTVEMLSDMVGVNRHKLSRAINRATDSNFNQYINELRIREVILLMDSTDYSKLSIDALMEQVGFSSRSAFYESFKKATGLTPAQYWKSRQSAK